MYEMKESGIEWIGQIPKHWEVTKIKKYFINKKQIAGIKSDNYERLALTLHGVVKRSKEDVEGLQPTDFSTYQIVNKDDLIFKLIDLQNISTSRVGLSPYTGIVSSAYIRLESCSDVSSNYAEYFFKMMWYNKIFNYLGDSGVRSSLNASELMNLLMIFPSLNEQKKISDFLDNKVTEIDNLIDDTKKLIKKYKEYKYSLITETVIKGLYSSLEMKESGIEWIGQIPKHWEVTKIKKYFINKKQIAGIKSDNYERLALTLHGVVKRSKEDVEGLQPTDFSTYQIVNKDDLIFKLIDLQNISTSRVGLSPYTGIVSSAYIRLESCSDVSSNYAEYFFKMMWYNKIFNYLGDSGVRSSLNAFELMNLLMIFPPLDEQEEIVKYLDDKCSQIDSIIEEKQSLIEKLEEYKKSLIYEYVTGKKQV